MELLKKTGLVLAAGAISFLFIFGPVCVALLFANDYFKTSGMLEPKLFTGALLQPVGLVFVAGWLWISGKFLSKDKLRVWGLRLLYLYLAAAIIPYLFSFLVTPAN